MLPVYKVATGSYQPEYINWHILCNDITSDKGDGLNTVILNGFGGYILIKLRSYDMIVRIEPLMRLPNFWYQIKYKITFLFIVTYLQTICAHSLSPHRFDLFLVLDK